MLVEVLNASKNTFWRNSTQDLGKRKICERLVPHELNENHKSEKIFDKKNFLIFYLKSLVIFRTHLVFEKLNNYITHRKLLHYKSC